MSTIGKKITTITRKKELLENLCYKLKYLTETKDINLRAIKDIIKIACKKLNRRDLLSLECAFYNFSSKMFNADIYDFIDISENCKKEIDLANKINKNPKNEKIIKELFVSIEKSITEINNFIEGG